MSLELARTVADAVLYEGYLLYPYRASSSKNQSRWQWGVLGPPGAAAAGLGEEPAFSTQVLLRADGGGEVTVHLRFLQLQSRTVERSVAPTRFEPVDELTVGANTLLTWDEAVEHEIELGPCRLDALTSGVTLPVTVEGGEEIEPLHDENGTVVGRVVRRRKPLQAVVSLSARWVDDLVQLSIAVDNVASESVTNKVLAIQLSLIGAHLLVRVDRGHFVSLLEPPPAAAGAAAKCSHSRCWPVLAGVRGSADVMLVSPIILYDYPEVAEQSAGALFDATEIDEILTLRVMTLTDAEKAAARATDPRAAAIIDRCDAMSPESMQALHGILRDPHAAMQSPTLDDVVPALTEVPTFVTSNIVSADPPTFDTGGAPWWDPAADASVAPETDTVLIDGILVSKDSRVRLHPSRRADAQDIFFAGLEARVTAVLSDVDGQIHVAVVLVDDPAADLHEWYGRYMYYAPDELEPLDDQPTPAPSIPREESRS